MSDSNMCHTVVVLILYLNTSRCALIEDNAERQYCFTNLRVVKKHDRLRFTQYPQILHKASGSIIVVIIVGGGIIVGIWGEES